MSLGEQLMALRRSAGQSLQEVADAVGVSKAHIWELEKGRSQNPSFDLVCRLADHFGVTPDVFSGRAQLPDARGQTVARVHRLMQDMQEDDLSLIETMIQSLQEHRNRLVAEK